MNSNISYNKIITDENLMETIQHGSNNYPFNFYYDNLSQFDFNCIEWHWHTELEFVYIESGTVTFWIGEKQFDLSERNGVFINSKPCTAFILLLKLLSRILYVCLLLLLRRIVSYIKNISCLYYLLS